MDHSRVGTTTLDITQIKVPLMPMRMEITSIKDVNPNFYQGEESKGLENKELNRKEEVKEKGKMLEIIDIHEELKPLVQPTTHGPLR